MTAALDLLARNDKWYLSAGEGLIWAPTFPVWLDAPGFWDEARLFEYALQPLFSVAFVDDSGREVPLRALRRRWTPAALEVPYAPARGLELAETRMVLPGFVLGSEWQIVNVGVTRVKLHAIAWTTAPGEDVGPGDVAFDESELTWSRALKEARSAPLALKLQLAMARGADSWGAVRAERTADHPHFALTPFWDRWDPMRGGLRSGAELAGSRRGQVYLGVHRAIDIEPGSAARLAVALRVVPELPPSRARVESPAPARASSFHAASRASWESFFQSVPTFRCSDPYLERYWAYRWYGLRLGGLAAGWGSYVAPSVATGVGAHHVPVAETVPCHVRELRWAKDPEWARGVLRTLFAAQRADGSLPDRIGVLSPTEGGFSQADLGGALLALDAVHPSDAFLREVLPALERYAAWLLRAQDADGSGLIDAPQPESREGAGDAGAEERADEAGVRLKSVNLSVYAYEVCRALSVLGSRGGLEEAPWRARAEKTQAALLKRMWDGKGGMFADVNVVTGRRSSTRSVGSFYPYGTDVVAAPHLAGFVQNLFDPRQFWKPFPVSSLSGKDAQYDPDAALQGRRLDRPWNGRVWPSANSRVADAIARVAIHHLPALRAHLAEFVTKFVHMMFWEGDASRPNSYEHYHPVSGRPSAYRGLDDCQHSWVNDLIVQYVIGLRPDGEGRCVVDPMPFGLDGFEAVGLPMQGRAVDVALGGGQVKVTVAGREAAKGRVGEPISVRL